MPNYFFLFIGASLGLSASVSLSDIASLYASLNYSASSLRSYLFLFIWGFIGYALTRIFRYIDKIISVYEDVSLEKKRNKLGRKQLPNNNNNNNT